LSSNQDIFLSLCRKIRDFPDYLGLYDLAVHFQELQLSPELLSSARVLSTYQDGRIWSKTVAADPLYLGMVALLSLCIHVSPLDSVIDAVAEFKRKMTETQQINKWGAYDLLPKDNFITPAIHDDTLAEIRMLGALEHQSSLTRENIEILLKACREMTGSLDWDKVVNPIVQKCGISNQTPPLASALVIASVSTLVPKNRTLQITCGTHDTWFLVTLTHGVLGKNVCVTYQSGGKDTLRFGETPEQVAIKIVEGMPDVKVSLGELNRINVVRG
jgi:hypothetical protein